MMRLSAEQLAEIAQELAARPGHETVRSDVRQLLIDGLRVPRADVRLEAHIPEVRGRIDALLGRTVLEFKSDLRRERDDAESQLTRYIRQRQEETGERYVGIATDGARFISYELRRDELRELAAYALDPADARGILAWLSAAVAAGEELDPDPATVVQELGRPSPAWRRSLGDLREAWSEVRAQPEARLKRQLWAQRLERVYGSPVDADDFFFQHTYLAVVAKTIAVHVLGIPVPDPRDLLSGRPFEQAGITGAVESDFFDWILEAGGDDLVRRIALHASRFRLREVQIDVLKGLYESLIDPEDRHDLGEYYTPDWLAARVCETAIDRPLDRRVLDPSCGSGTFLFHAVRRVLAAAEADGLDLRAALERCIEKVVGIDIHPVAVQIARVTYLLALGEERLSDPARPPLAVPVYLGDALQWNVQGFLAEQDVLIEVPDGPVLHFPDQVTRSPADFDSVIELMLRQSDAGAGTREFAAALRRQCRWLDDKSVAILSDTYSELSALRAQGRNHIWGFVARNLVRPVWLSSDEQRVDCLIGNPPWLSYRYMSRETQRRFREESQRRRIWQGGKVATHQDLSAYFFARCCWLYCKSDARIAFVMPYAAMSRRQFQGFRSGNFADPSGREIARTPAHVRFTDAWVFDDDVQPLFEVPSCVLFASVRNVDQDAPLPRNVHRASGRLPRRDATAEQAARHLAWADAPWPPVIDETAASPYGAAFRQGATFVPRFLCLVEQAPPSPIGGNPQAPLVVSRRSRQEKAPWKDLPALEGNVERRFLRLLYLGESVAPFRLLEPVQAVIPWDPDFGLLDAAAAGRAGYPHLAAWLSRAEGLWDAHRSSDRLSFAERIDYHRELTAQLPPAALRVVYSTSGTLMVAAVISDREVVVDTSLYWAGVQSRAEAHYLVAVLTSETTRGRFASLQARGQWGARHFHKVMWTLPIREFDPDNPLHAEIASVGLRAELVAAEVPLKEGVYFVTARRQIRHALAEDGVAGEIDGLVEELLSARPSGG